MAMERRSAPRMALDTGAMLQPLQAGPGANPAPWPVRVVDASDGGLRIVSTEPLAVGQTVKIESGDAMFLGEICYRAPAPEAEGGGYYLGVITKECLAGLHSLSHLIQALQPEPAGARERAGEPKRGA